ncbi:transposase [Micromonospora sp. LZ34]
MSDLFGVGGRELLSRAPLDGAYRGRVSSLCRLIDAVDFEIDALAGPIRARLAGHHGYTAVQAISGVGPVLAAVFVAEIGEVDRFPGPAQLASWARLTPWHRKSDLIVHRGRITKQGSTLVRWAAVEAARGVPRSAGWVTSTAPASPNDADATSPPSRWPASCSPSSTTAYATDTSVPSARPRRRREQVRT